MRRLSYMWALPVLVFATVVYAQQTMRLAPPEGGLVHGQKTTNETNGAEALSTAMTVVSVSLKASCNNTVVVHVGGSTLNAASSPGRTLAPCEPHDLDVKNLNQIYLDSGTTAATIEYDGVQGP